MHLRFEYKPTGAPTPQKSPKGTLQDDYLHSRLDSEDIPIPDVGDSVEFEVSGQWRQYLVLSRHFGYGKDDVDVCVVVTDIAPADLAARSSDHMEDN